MIRYITIERIALFGLIAISLFFFQITLIPEVILRYINFIMVFPLAMISLLYFFRPTGGLVVPVQMIILSICFSILMGYLSWQQPISDNVKVTMPYFIWFLFFLFLKLKVSLEDIEQVVMVFGVLYLLLYFFQYFNSQTVFFGWNESFAEQRGVLRIVFPGTGIFFMAYFIALNRLFNNGRSGQGFLWAFVLLGIVATLLQVTRQTILAMLLISSFHFLRYAGYFTKIWVVFGLMLAAVFVYRSDHPVITGILSTFYQDIQEGTEYIRFLSGSYFLFDYSPNLISRIFGNGIPYGNSDFAWFEFKLKEVYGYYLADVGLIGFYAMFGIFAVVGYLLLIFRGFFIKVSPRYQYLKYYLFFLLITSLTSDSLFSESYMIANLFVIYGLQVFHESNNHDLLEGRLRNDLV